VKRPGGTAQKSGLIEVLRRIGRMPDERRISKTRVVGSPRVCTSNRAHNMTIPALVRFGTLGTLLALLLPVDSVGALFSAADPRTTLDQYCSGCHNQRLRESSVDSSLRLTVDNLEPENVAADRETWEKIVRRLRAGMMPPRGVPRPDDAMVARLVSWLEGELDQSAVTYLPAPGLHRMNRTEYANAIRDLLDLNIDPALYLPSDDSSNGFDNMAGTLGLSSTLVEAYVVAASKISTLAVGEAAAPYLAVYRVPEDTSQDYHVAGLPFGTRGGLLREHFFPSDGEYTLTVLPVFGDNMSPQGFGSIEGEQIEVLLDGERIALLDWQSRRGQGVAVGGGTSPMQVRFEATGGPHQVGVTFLETNLAPVLDLNRQFDRKTIQTGPTPGFTFFPHVGAIRIEGPYNASVPAESPSRRKIFSCRPDSAAAEAERLCAREIAMSLASQAFRRPATQDDIERLMEFYETGRDEADFDRGIELVLARILASPNFLYRREVEPPGLEAGQPYRINDLELASRLSYFLWSRGPDEELRQLAIAGRLSDPQVLEQQVGRMLEDARSEALATNFAGQWLNLRGISSHSPLPMRYPDFDDPLRQSMRREVELLFETIIREDRSIVELLTADYTFVDERLARHYGIPNVYGSQFRRVTLGSDLDVRRGLLGKGVILTTTAKPDRTSPVTRGKWILTNLLGVSPPDPPPNVPPLPERADDGRGNAAEPTMRQKMLDHRVRPDCAQCHSLMDPIGFALENFDGVALWRTEESGVQVDPVAVLYDNTEVNGPSGLREWLVARSDQFAQVAVEKLMTYALGRGVEYQDMPVARSITRKARSEDYRMSSLILGVVNSAPFQMNMNPGQAGSANAE
jgi:hypothetical protein